MGNYITEDYIDLSELERAVLEDKELMENINGIREQEERGEEFQKWQKDKEWRERITFAFITVAINLIILLIQLRLPRGFERQGRIDKSLTEEVSKIVNDVDVNVWILDINMVNAFNIGTPDLYLTVPLLRKLKLSRGEIVGICLHEYGHYAGKHMRTIAYTNTAVGIMVPVILREFMDSTGAAFYILSKILALLVSGVLRVYIGRPQEYFADSYAAKAGYGKDLISALNKLDWFVRKQVCKDKTKEQCDLMIDNISRFDEHPTLKKRVENILNSPKVISIIKSGKIKLLIGFFNKIKSLIVRD